MKRWSPSAGMSLIEVLVSLALVSVVMTIMAALLVDNSRLNRQQHRWIEIQSNARSTMELVSQTTRTAGWDPAEIGFSPVTLDSTPGDGIETLDVFADLNGDGDLLDPGESVTIRHVAATNRIEWRRSTAGAWETVAIHITNDADGDGVPEPMFTPDATPDPRRITIRITAGSSDSADPQAGPLIYTVLGDILLRNQG